MKLFTRIFISLVTVTVFSSWGFFAHKRINRIAVFTLPRAMAGFYEANIDFIAEHAVDPDKKRYVDSGEGPKHFIDIDHYGKNPFAKIPERWAEAERRYSADSLDKYGTVPWTIQHYYYKLVDAFKRRDTMDILHTSANLGHYIADAFVPLHLTQNYNGQLTNQTGLHALWESRLPELFADHYNYYVGKARYISNPLNEAFRICHNSFNSVDSVLRFERMLNKTFPADKKYEMVMHGKKEVKDYSADYARAYHKMLKGMVERRMRSAILAVGSYWYSAWADAGQPDLNKLIDKPLGTGEKLKLDQEEALYKSGKRLVLTK